MQIFQVFDRHCSIIFTEHIKVSSLFQFLGLKRLMGPIWGLQGEGCCLCGQERARRIHVSSSAPGPLPYEHAHCPQDALRWPSPSSPLLTMETNARTGLSSYPGFCQEQPIPQLCNLFHITEFEVTHQENCLLQNILNYNFFTYFLHLFLKLFQELLLGSVYFCF
jgi:hypothetical protein